MTRDFDPKLSWNSLSDDCINDFYKPALKNCNLYQRLSGYFSSSVFAHIALEILELIETYCKENGINAFNEQKKENKKSTKQISFELFKKGLSIKEIAKERSLTSGTVESHLASYIPSGEVDILELIPLKKYQKMIKEIEAVEYKNLTHLKENVDKSYSFMELRMVLLSLNQEI